MTGEERIESYTVTGMAHGAPLATGTAEDQCGTAGAFLLDVGISSSFQIAKFWGLIGYRETPAVEEIGQAPVSIDRLRGAGEEDPIPEPAYAEQEESHARTPFSVHAVIAKALKSAGLMK